MCIQDQLAVVSLIAIATCFPIHAQIQLDTHKPKDRCYVIQEFTKLDYEGQEFTTPTLVKSKAKVVVEQCKRRLGVSPLEIDSSNRTYHRYTFTFGAMTLNAQMAIYNHSRLNISNVVTEQGTRQFKLGDIDGQEQRYMRDRMLDDGVVTAYYLNEDGTYVLLANPDDDRR